MLTDVQQKQLAQDLPRDVVKTRSQAGQTLSYVPGDYVIRRLNEVFGHDGWSIEYGTVTILPGDRPVVYVQATLRAAGIGRSDVGVGLAANGKGDALETALKAAFTDGLKRCARTLGDSLGLALYDKEQANVGYSFTCQEILAAFDAATDAAGLDAAIAQTRKVYNDLPGDEKTAVVNARKLAETRVHGASKPQAAPAQPPAAQPKPSAQPHPSAQMPVTNDDAAVSRVKGATTVDHLLAILMAHGSTSDRVWTAAVSTAASLDASVNEEVLRSELDAAQKGGADPRAWGTVADVLGALGAATTVDGVAQAVGRYAEGVKALPDGLRKICRNQTSVVKYRLRVASASLDDLKKIYGDLTESVKTGTVGAAQAKWITDLLNDRAARLEATAAQNQAA